MNAPVQPDLTLLILCFILFTVIWCGVVGVISFIGGWHGLAKSFRAEETTFRVASLDDELRFRFASMTTGPKYFPTNYGNCLMVHVGGTGIQIAVWLPFRFLHPPLHIPWESVERCEPKRFFLFFPRTVVYLRNRRRPLCFFGRAGKAIFDTWLQQTTSETSPASAASSFHDAEAIR